MPFPFTVLTLTCAYLLVGVLERRPALRFRALTAPRPFLATDAGWYALAVGATAITSYVLAPWFATFAVSSSARALGQLPWAARLAIGVVAFDAVSFAVHVTMHRSDLLWSFHKVHHSTLELDGFATTRSHLFENMVRFIPPQLLLYVIGLPVSVVAPTVALAAIYGISNHSNLDVRASWLEAVLVTPRIHRRHHVPSTTQNNFGAILTVWDRLAGTLLRRDTDPGERYGVPGEVDTFPQRLPDALRAPFRQVRALRAAQRTG